MIRTARITDYPYAAPLLYNALHELAIKLTGGTTTSEVLQRLEFWFTQSNNRLSFENCLVVERENKVVGIILLYHGSEAARLDAPINTFLRTLTRNPSITLEKEADEDEYYIDTISVDPLYRGQGIGTNLIAAAEKQAKQLHYSKISLLVDIKNERAFSLYTKLSFKQDKTVYLLGHPYAHLIKEL